MTVVEEVAKIIKDRNIYPAGYVPLGLLVCADMIARDKLNICYDDSEMTEEQRDSLRNELISAMEEDARMARMAGLRPPSRLD